MATPVQSCRQSASRDWEKRCFGTRCALALFGGLLPTFGVLFVLPFVPIYYGHVSAPAILLSNMMSAKATYQSLYTVGFSIPAFHTIFLATDAFQHFNDRGVRRATTNTCLFFITLAVGCGLQTLLAFNFDAPEITWETFVHTWCHYLGTMSYFIFSAVAATIYTLYIRPEAVELGAMHPKDAACFKIAGESMAIGTLVAGGIRFFHIQYPLTWCYPMLFIECIVVGLGSASAFLAHWRLFMHLDAVDPLLDFSFLKRNKAA